MRWPAPIVVALSLAMGCQRRESVPVAPPDRAFEARSVTPAPELPLVPLTRVDGFSRESSPLVLAKAGSRELAFVALEGSVNVFAA